MRALALCAKEGTDAIKVGLGLQWFRPLRGMVGGWVEEGGPF